MTQIAAKIVSELTAVTDACEGPPRCHTCVDCDNWLEEAIAAALAEQDAEIARLTANFDVAENERVALQTLLRRLTASLNVENFTEAVELGEDARRWMDAASELEASLAQAHARIAQLEAALNLIASWRHSDRRV